MGDAMILFLISLAFSVRMAGYASYLMRNGKTASSVGVWIITFFSVVITTVLWQS